jgi:hypothetical protein
MWAENALFVIGKEITNRKSENALDEALLGAEALVAIVKELKKRSTNDF